MNRKKISPEAKKALYLQMVDQGAEDFMKTRGHHTTPLVHKVSAPPTLGSVALSEDIEPSAEELGLEPPPQEAEVYSFEEPSPSRKSLKKRGWVPATHLYEPKVLDAATALAKDMGITFAELQNIALGLVVDTKRRPSATDELLHRVKARFN